MLAGELPEADPESAHHVADARRELALAIEELRDVAHGIYPSILADEGLAAALEGLAEGATVPVSVQGVPVDRLDPTVEAAAYAVVAEATATGTGAVRVTGGVGDGTLVLTVSGPELPEETLIELGDRIGAADGRLDVRPDAAAGRLILRAELPCAS